MSAEVLLEKVAHGGFVVARHAGKVVFVTGGLPGERVRIEITEPGKRFDRGRVLEVLDPAPGRVDPPCPVAADCGGCDWQFADQATQLGLKTAVVGEQLERLAGITWAGQVESVQGGLLDWRTRLRLVADDLGRVGFRKRRSHEIVALPSHGCAIAAKGINYSAVQSAAGPGEEVLVAVADKETTIVGPRAKSGPDPVIQQVGQREYQVSATGFWQVHQEAARLLSQVVREGLNPRSGENALDLYCGVGLFAGMLVDAGCQVFGVELGREAIRAAKRNVPEAQFLAAPLESALGKLPRRADLVVLDPPRKGAGTRVVRAIAKLQARAIAYVACDPAALARDLATFQEVGYEPSTIRGFDLFPMTHHVECVAILHPTGEAGR